MTWWLKLAVSLYYGASVLMCAYAFQEHHKDQQAQRYQPMIELTVLNADRPE